MSSFRAPLLGLAAVAMAGTMAACGGSSNSTATASSSSDPNDQAVKFAQCMRQHGIDMPDPQPGKGGGFGFRARGPKGQLDSQKFQTAQNACRKLLPNGGRPNLTPAQRAQFRDAALKFAQCMRAHGVNIPDPQEGKPQLLIRGNSNSPAFKSAMQACQSKLPKIGQRAGTPSSGGSTAK
jgi:hypothetical protein